MRYRGHETVEDGRGRPRRVAGRLGLLSASMVCAATLIAGLGLPGHAHAAPESGSAPTIKAASDVDFFVRPASITAWEPGEIVKARPVQARSLHLLPMAVDAWQLMYRTNTLKGPDVAITTVMVAKGTSPKGILSYQSAVDAVAPKCLPSRSLLSNAPIDFSDPGGPLVLGQPGAEALVMAAGLAKGWAVSVPDYPGMDSHFLVPREPGYLILDGIRATQRFEPLGLDAQTPVGLWGYSGGGMATSWAVEAEGEYAPELNIRGNAIGAPLRDVGAGLRNVIASPTSGLLPMGLASLAKQSPEYERALSKYLTPHGRAEMKAAANQCTAQSILQNLWLHFDARKYLNVPVSTFLADPVIRRALEELDVSDQKPVSPTYLYNAIDDEIVLVEATDRLARSYCRGDGAVTYRREQLPPALIPALNSPHVIEYIAGIPGAFAWLTEQMSSTRDSGDGCDVRTLPSTALEPGSLQQFPPVVAGAIEAALGLPITRR